MNKALPLFVMLLSVKMYGQTTPHTAQSAITSVAGYEIQAALLYWEKESPNPSDKPNEKQKDLTGQAPQLKSGEMSQPFDNYLLSRQDNSFSGKKELRSLATGIGVISPGVYLNRLPGNFNSQLGEMAPFRYADKLYFSSVVNDNYLPTKHKDKAQKFEQHPVTRIFESKHATKAMESDANPHSAILNATNVTLNADASKMYFTLCTDEMPNSQKECTIWYRNRTYEGEWTPAIKLPNHVNMRNYTATQPTVGYDWHLKKEVLYFVSDRPGGMGGMDIWFSLINRDGSLTVPRLVPFNTKSDEVSPFYHQQTQTLFFSSNGMNGMGGFDIFFTEKTEGQSWKLPQNLGAYLNTEGDELYYTFHAGSGFAYFISAAASEGIGGGDIIEAKIFTDMHFSFYSSSNQSPLASVLLEIKNLETGQEGIVHTGDFSHFLQAELDMGTAYQFTIKSPGYQAVEFEMETDKVGYIKKLEKDIYLTPVARP